MSGGADGDDSASSSFPWRAHFARGCYFGLGGVAPPFSRLVYPLPEPNAAGLGTHATVALDGSVRFGPDVEWLPEGWDPERATADDFAVDPARAEGFYGAIRRWWPELPDGALAPDYAGVRPKLSGPGEPAADFVLAAPAAGAGAGVRALSLLGVESPGLTSSLWLGEAAVDTLDAAQAGEVHPDVTVAGSARGR